MPKSRIHKIQTNQNGKTEFHLKKQYRIAVYEGGGAKGLAYPGGVEALADKENDILNNITCFAGSSAGAITATICALGYQGENLERVVDSIDANILLDRPLPDSSRELHALTSRISPNGRTKIRGEAEGEYYLNTGNNLLQTSREVIKARFEECYQEADQARKDKIVAVGIRHHMDINRITFSDLEYMKVLFPEKDFKDLIITGTQLSGHSGFIAGQNYFNAINTPNMEIALAARISASIPFVYKRVKYLGQYYTDGGMTYNLPLKYFINNNDYLGDIIALTFKHKVKKNDKHTPNPEKRMMYHLSNKKINSDDSDRYSLDAKEINANANNIRGIDIYSIDQGKLKTMSFGAERKTITDARTLTKEKINAQLKEKLKNNNQVANGLEEYTLDELQTYLHALNSKPENLVFYIDSDNLEISSTEHKNNLICEMKREIENKISVLENSNQQPSLDDTFDALVQENKERLKKQIQLSEDIENDNFEWLYNKIDKLITEKINDKFLSSWLKDLKNHASPMDIVLSRGIVLIDNATLNSIAENSKDEIDVKKARIQFDQTTKILNDLTKKITTTYNFANESQLRDAMGEIAKNNHLNDHRKFFELQQPKNMRDILSSPYVINDILAMNRMDDLSFIEYGAGNITTHIRSELIKKLKEEIRTGDTRWLTDLLTCSKLYKHSKNQANQPNQIDDESSDYHVWSNHIKTVYANEFGDLPVSENEWKKHYSAVVKLFTNPKLTDKNASSGNYSGHIDKILIDFADEVSAYLHKLKHDLNIETIKQIQLPIFDENEILNSRQNYLDQNIKASPMNPNYRKISLSDFDRRVYTERASKFSHNRKDRLKELCSYINNNPYTWYDNIFGINSILEYKQNPLLSLLSSTKMSRALAVHVIERLQAIRKNQIWMEENSTDLTQQKNNRIQAEKKISKGIKKLYNTIEKKYNTQGISTLTYTHEELKERGFHQYFPDNLVNGLTIHIFKNEGAKKILPIQHIVESKIKALCQGAKTLVNHSEQIQNVILDKFLSEFSKLKIAQINTDKLNEFLGNYTSLTLSALYEDRKTVVTSQENFFSKVLETAKRQRVSDQDILTFDLNENKFSYEHVKPGTSSSHDRIIGNKTANLGIGFDGVFDISGSKFNVTNSLIHHASLSPLETNNTSELASLIDTCNHIEEITLTMADLQKFGQPNEAKVIEVNWCHQLLTPNIRDHEEKKESYLRMGQAVDLMDNFTTMHGETNINLNISMINAGMNKYTKLDKDFTERENYNQKAWLHLNRSLINTGIPTSINKNDNVFVAYNNVCVRLENKEYENLKLDINENSNEFNKWRKIYNAINDRDSLDLDVDSKSLLIKYNVSNIDELTEKLNAIIGHDITRKQLNKEISHCISQSEKLNNLLDSHIENMHTEMKERWINNSQEHQSFLTRIRDDAEKNTYSAEEIPFVCALMLKAYMDNLYYTDKYLDPVNAPLFNAYTAAYQQLIGMIPTISGTHGNTRTYITRLLMTAIAGRDINSVTLPSNYSKDQENLAALKIELEKIALSNAACYTAINDTATPPNIDSNQFEILKKKGKDNSIFNSMRVIGRKNALDNLYGSEINVDKNIKDEAANIVEQVKLHQPQIVVKTQTEVTQTIVESKHEASSLVIEEAKSEVIKQTNDIAKYEDRELFLNTLLHRILSIVNGQDIKSVFEAEYIKRSDTSLAEEYTNIKDIFDNWIKENPEREIIINYGRGISAFYDAETEQLHTEIKTDLADITELANAFSTALRQDEDLAQALNEMKFIQNFKNRIEDNRIYIQDAKTLLAYKFYNNEDVSKHWLRDEEISKITKSFEPDKVTCIQALASELNEVLIKSNDTYPIYIMLNDSTDGTKSGSHWSAMKINMVDDGIHVEYVDSQDKKCPYVIEKTLKDYFQSQEVKINSSCLIRQHEGYECGYLSLYQIGKWLKKETYDFNDSQYIESMDTLRNRMQKDILDNTIYNGAKSIKSKNVFFNPSKSNITNSVVITQNQTIIPQITTPKLDALETSKITSDSIEQLRNEFAYLNLLLHKLKSVSEIDIALAKRDIGRDGITINSLEDINSEFEFAEKTGKPPRLDTVRGSTDSLRKKNILNDNALWTATSREGIILEAVLWNAEGDIYADKSLEASEAYNKTETKIHENENTIRRLIKKPELSIEESNLLASLPGENDALSTLSVIQQTKVTNVTHSSASAAIAVNKKLAQYISTYGFLDSPNPTDTYKLQTDFINHILVLSGQYQIRIGIADEYLECINDKASNKLFSFEHVSRFNDAQIADTLKNNKPYKYFLVRKRTGFNSREWLLYHLDSDGKIVIKQVAEDPALSNLNALIKNERRSSVINYADKAAEAVAEYFYHQSVTTQERNENAEATIHKIPGYIHDAKNHAKHIWNTQIKERLQNGENIALIHQTYDFKLEKLLNTYNNLDQAISPLFNDSYNQTVFFKEIALLIEENKCRDRVHILPIPESDKNPRYLACMENIAKHVGSDFKVIGLSYENGRISNNDIINNDFHDLLLKPVAEWKPELIKAYQSDPVGISLFNNTDLIDDMKDRIKSEQNCEVLKKIRNALDIKEKNKEIFWKNLVNISRTYLNSNHTQNDKLDLLIRSISEYDQNLKHWPDIKTLDELINAQQKRDAIKNEITDDYIRLKEKQSQSEILMVKKLAEAHKEGNKRKYQLLMKKVENENPSLDVEMKLHAYRMLKDAILNSDKHHALSTILSPHSEQMNTPLDRYIYPLPNASIKSALKHKRGWIGLKEASSQTNLNTLRNKLVDMDSAVILNSIQRSEKEVINVSDTIKSDDLVNGLLNIQEEYSNSNRKTHTQDIIELIKYSRAIAEKTDSVKSKLIIDKISAALDKTKTSDTKKSFVKFFDKDAYTYPMLLERFLNQFKLSDLTQEISPLLKKRG